MWVKSENTAKKSVTQVSQLSSFPQLSHNETSVHIWVAAVRLFLCVLHFWHELWHLVAHMLLLLSEHHPNTAWATEIWKVYCFQANLRKALNAKTWSGACVWSEVHMPQNMCTQFKTSFKLSFYEFIKSQKMLISCCHYNWFVELVSTMGGKILRGTVHVVIFFLAALQIS